MPPSHPTHFRPVRTTFTHAPSFCLFFISVQPVSLFLSFRHTTTYGASIMGNPFCFLFFLFVAWRNEDTVVFVNTMNVCRGELSRKLQYIFLFDVLFTSAVVVFSPSSEGRGQPSLCCGRIRKGRPLAARKGKKLRCRSFFFSHHSPIRVSRRPVLEVVNVSMCVSVCAGEHAGCLLEERERKVGGCLRQGPTLFSEQWRFSESYIGKSWLCGVVVFLWGVFCLTFPKRVIA